MKALSIQQPWAWLIVNGYKAIENRTWATAYRGPLLIHAGKKIDTSARFWLRQHFPNIALPASFDLGGIVGRALLVRCVHERGTDHTLTVDERRWFFGPYGFLMYHAKPLPFRPLRGQLGLFEVPDA